MKAHLVEETYFLKGIDKTGLIPRDASTVLIKYGEDKKIIKIYFAPKCGSKILAPETERRTYQKKVDQMNSKERTPEEMKKIAGLLKKLLLE
jgi:hypothetical protein